MATDLLVVGACLLLLMLVLLGSGVWVAISLGMVAAAGLILFTDTPAGLSLATSMWSSNESWSLAALPMFIWMGEILFRTKLSEQMFDGLAAWLNHVPGRLLHTTVLGCGIFGSVSGSSAATCATIAKVALPELARRGYDQKIAIGSVATAGTLGILIPPSIAMVVYAVAADASIIRVFLAGFVPGLLVMLLFSGYIVWWALRNPVLQPPAEPGTSLREKLYRSRRLLPIMLLLAFIIVTLVSGWATTTECAAFGVLGSLAIAAQSRSLSCRNFMDGLMGAMRTSCMIMFILAAAKFLTVTMAFTGIPAYLANWVAQQGFSTLQLIGALTIVYLILGTALDGVSMIVLTATVVLPIIQKAGIDLVWFGIFIVLLMEIAAVTPPVGFNLFVMQNMSGKDSTTVAMAALPFFFCLLACVVIITAFPQLVTFVPDLVMGPK